ncbi:STAS domain-containing protein [Georgenia sp. SYP-B2076]|uniref:STAS domain-containing protein n=1 Tax=Georgenia sp. SYP-B2076 TaxID=2495881 RepID=UPI000F8DF9ED|nr:STAS domain-containing protein [Georgenia sp. SYP-B2076]
MRVTTAPARGDAPAASWLTATIRPAGVLAREDAPRLRDLLEALAASASLVVVDLGAARLLSTAAAAAIEDAADGLERRGGCLLCVGADQASRRCLASVGARAVVLDG